MPKKINHEERMCKEFSIIMKQLVLDGHIPDLLFYTHIDNGQRSGGAVSRKIAGGIAKQMGTLPGVWDYLFVDTDGVPAWIEFKYGKNRLSADQVAFGELLDRANIPKAVAYSLDEAFDFFR
jgi:hypothetical protein